MILMTDLKEDKNQCKSVDLQESVNGKLKMSLTDNLYNSLLFESQESKSIDAAKKLAMQHGYSHEQADKLVRYNIRHDFPFFSRNKKGNKFILGVTRMFLNGQLRDASTMNNLNTTLKYVASDAHYDEYDRNLNDMSAQDLISRFAKNVEMDLENDRNEVDSMSFEENNSSYDIVRIDSFEQAYEYYEYTYGGSPWCLTYSKVNYNSYTCNGMNQLYFCLRKGFENVKPIPGEGCPLDEYGLSMISVIVDENGALAYCTSRWNHSNGGTDSVMDTRQISEVIGMNFYNVFKPNNKWKEMVETAMQRLRNGENPREVFGHCGSFHDGLAMVRLKSKWNFINKDGNLVSPNRWFDYCNIFYEGFAVVNIDRKWNFIRKDGSLLFPDRWFDSCNDFHEGFAVVSIKGKWNFIKEDGTFLLNKPVEEWFDGCDDFHEGFAGIEFNRKWNFIRKDGSLLLDKPFEQWFDWCVEFHEGLAVVELDRKYNFINQDGVLLLNKPVKQWFYYCSDFKNGRAIVGRNGKYNFIRKDGSFLLDKPVRKWFDHCSYFHEGFAVVGLNGKYNWITENGSLVSPDLWFDSCHNFKNGYGEVKLNIKWYYIDTEGDLYDSLTQKPLGINVNTMSTQNESLSIDYKNIISEVIRKRLVQIEEGVDYKQNDDGSVELNKVSKINEGIRLTSIKKSKTNKKPINEIKHIAEKSNITVTSLSDFKNLVKSMGITDSNVDDCAKEYCFIEIGSSLSRLNAEVPLMDPMQDDDSNLYNGETFFNKGQWYFQEEHVNVIKLVFDDNQKFNNKLPKKDGFDGNTPATAVKLNPHENRFKKSMTFYYTDGKDFSDDVAIRLKKFVDDALERNPNIKFIIHCMQGKSRSAAIAMYVAKKIDQFSDEFLSEYDDEENSQFNIGISTKGMPKYPHKNAMEKLGELEGWNKPKTKSQEQWYYDTLINHPITGYADKKKNKVSESINRKIIVGEKQLAKLINEDVFVNNADDNKKTANLTYKKRNDSYKKNKGNLNSFDMLKTDKMDKLDDDTYEKKLKCGITSFNITSIKGTEVMHYFKRRFGKKQPTNIKLNSKEYELIMADDEFRNFIDTFKTKVANVIKYQIAQEAQYTYNKGFDNLLIYPVPSSSNFNVTMAKIIAMQPFSGMKVQVVDPSIMKKDFSRVEVDDDFIQQNKEYYNSPLNDSFKDKNHIDNINYYKNKLQVNNILLQKCDYANQCADELIRKYYTRNYAKNGLTTKFIDKLEDLYNKYVAACVDLYKTEDGKYEDPIRGKTSNLSLNTVIKPIKYTKGPSVEIRSEEILNILNDNGRLIKKGRRKIIPIQRYAIEDSEIKKMPNDARMGMKNYFSVDRDKYKENQITPKNSLVVIFDDNISGGATLNDICVNFENLAFRHIIPITFGEMGEKYNVGTLTINAPEGGKFKHEL